jgi:phytoene dehydrogenase-like protein
MGGLLTARVLAERFTSVTVLDRDALPGDAATRKGVPRVGTRTGCSPLERASSAISSPA